MSSPKPSPKWLHSTLGFLSIGVIATIPFPFAAVQPWVWSFYCLLMILAFVVSLWTERKDSHARPQGRYPIATVPVALFFAWTLFLCLPLPHAALSAISPGRADVLSRTWVLTDHVAVWATLSYSPTRAFSWWLFLLSLGLFYRVLSGLFLDPGMLKRVVGVVVAVGLVEAAYGLMQVLVPSMGVLTVKGIPDYLGTARGTFINRNNFAGFIEMIWPLALGAMLAQTDRVASFKAALASDRFSRQVLSAVGVIILLLALIFSRSRAGIAGGLVGLLVFSVMARTGIRAPMLKTRILFGAAVVLLCMYTFAIGVGPVVERFLTIFSDGRFRLDIWRDSLPIIRDHPPGIGLRNYDLVFPPYDRSLNVDLAVTFAHNDYLQLLVETGWIGFVAIVGGWLVFLGRGARRIRQMDSGRDPLRFYLAVGALSGLVSMGVHCLVDFNLQIPANCVYLVILMAVLSVCTRPLAGHGTSGRISMEKPLKL